MATIMAWEDTHGGYEFITKLLNERDIAKAEAIDGWVYITFKDGDQLCITAEYGASLDGELYPKRT